MSAPFSFRDPTVGFGDDEAETAEAPDDVPDLPPSPEEIQIDAADVDQFDQSYLARSQNFKLEGQFSPAPFPLQVIPRVAYTINYNFVYNEDKGRWEADTGNGSSVETGTVSFSRPAASQNNEWDPLNSKVHTVPLSQDWSEPPVVVGTINNAASDDGLIRIDQVTTSDFRLIYLQISTETDDGVVGVNWIAAEA